MIEASSPKQEGAQEGGGARGRRKRRGGAMEVETQWRRGEGRGNEMREAQGGRQFRRAGEWGTRRRSPNKKGGLLFGTGE